MKTKRKQSDNKAKTRARDKCRSSLRQESKCGGVVGERNLRAMRWEQDSCIHTHIYTHIQMAGCSDDEGFDGRIVRMAVHRALSRRTQREVAHHSSTNRPSISRDTIAIPNSDFYMHTSPCTKRRRGTNSNRQRNPHRWCSQTPIHQHDRPTKQGPGKRAYPSINQLSTITAAPAGIHTSDRNAADAPTGRVEYSV